MPRRPRLNLANGPLHVIQRGNNRQACAAPGGDLAYWYGRIGGFTGSGRGSGRI